MSHLFALSPRAHAAMGDRGAFPEIQFRKMYGFVNKVVAGRRANIHQPSYDFHIDDVRCLEGVHSEDYVRGVLSGRIENGFGDMRKALALLSIQSCARTAQAALYAMRNRTGVCAPYAGFHHAGYDFGGGFCTFNGLNAAARAVGEQVWQREQRKARILIYDGDAHFGNGCIDILQRGPAFQGREAPHVTYHGIGQGRKLPWNLELPRLARLLAETESRPWDCVLYQAGADAYKYDDMGAGNYSLRELGERDALVFGESARRGIPLVWTLAGGYNERVTPRLHELSWNAYAEAYPYVNRERQKAGLETVERPALQPNPAG